MSLNWYKCFILSCYVTTDYLVFTCVHAFLIQMLHTVMLCYHWLLSIHMCTCLFVFPGIGQGLSLDRAVIPGKYRPGIPRTYKPTNVHTRTCTWYLYLYLVCQYLMYLSTWLVKIQSTCTCTCTWLRVLEVLEYLTNCTWPQPWSECDFYVGSTYDDIHLHVAQSYTPSPDSPFSLGVRHHPSHCPTIFSQTFLSSFSHYSSIPIVLVSPHHVPVPLQLHFLDLLWDFQVLRSINYSCIKKGLRKDIDML